MYFLSAALAHKTQCRPKLCLLGHIGIRHPTVDYETPISIEVRGSHLHKDINGKMNMEWND